MTRSLNSCQNKKAPTDGKKPHTHPPGFKHDTEKEKAQKAEIDAEIKRS